VRCVLAAQRGQTPPAGDAGINNRKTKQPMAKLQPGLKPHPLAEALPKMPTKEFNELKDNIRENGMKIPLLVAKDLRTIIDGRHRWLVAADLRLKAADLPFEVFKGKDEDIPAEIIARNILRRHLTTDQRGALVLKLRGPALEKEAKERQAAKSGKSGSFKANGETKGTKAQQLAKEAHISEPKARQLIKASRTPGEVEKIIEGKATAKESARKAPATKRRAPKPKKEKSFDEKVWGRWLSFINFYTPSEKRRVHELVDGWLKGKAAPVAA
jgi:hypothetical protein